MMSASDDAKTMRMRSVCGVFGQSPLVANRFNVWCGTLCVVTGEYWWLVYLIFLAIPLARILPRIISRRSGANGGGSSNDGYATAYGGDGRSRVDSGIRGRSRDGVYNHNDDNDAARRSQKRYPSSGNETWREGFTDDSHDLNRAESARARHSNDSTSGQTDEMIVLGAMHRGAKTFESIQKMTRITDTALNVVLERLEKQGTLKVIQRQRLFGTRVELYLSDGS